MTESIHTLLTVGRAVLARLDLEAERVDEFPCAALREDLRAALHAATVEFGTPIAYYPKFERIAATNRLADEYAQEFAALVDSLRDEYLDDAEVEAAAAFEQIRGVVWDGARFTPVEPGYDDWNEQREQKEIERLDQLEVEG